VSPLDSLAARVAAAKYVEDCAFRRWFAARVASADEREALWQAWLTTRRALDVACRALADETLARAVAA
jgi:hypothetical protein